MTVEELAAALSLRGLSITAAESLTAGLFQNAIAKTEYASDIYPGGFITYSDDSKELLLGVGQDVIEKHGVVSREVALAMAENSRKIMRTSCSVAFTGVGGPDDAEGEKAGTVWIGVASGEGSRAEEFHFGGEPKEVLEQAIQAGAELLNSFLKLS